MGKAAMGAGRKLGSAYDAVDPDLRRHVAQLPAVGLSMLAPRGKVVEALPDDGCRPIVLVHGLGGHPGNFAALKQYLRLMGRKRIYSVDFGNAESLDVMAKMLQEIVQAVVERNELGPEVKLDLVAHSMGGLVARLAMEHEETEARVGLLITMGTPHGGTHLARLAGRAPAVNLRPNSELMERLASQPWQPRPDGPRLVALWSPADMLILPAEGAQAAGAENIELPGFTHYSYLLNPRGWRQVMLLLLEEEEAGQGEE